MLVTAHRGSSSQAPENTLAALSLAHGNGADYAEVDIQQTRDGKLVLLHDCNLARVAGVGRYIWELDVEAISELEVGSWFAEEFRGEKIPFLREAINLVKGKIKLNLELKIHGHEVNLAKNLVNILRKQDFLSECIVSSFDYDILQQIKLLEPRIKIGLITASKLDNWEDFEVDFYAVFINLVNQESVDKIHNLGREIHVWTVNDRETIKKLLHLGVDNIVTDTPMVKINK
jgi:glycerophosphoryl diester phosphodiesterase